jgi:hypothetical protein
MSDFSVTIERGATRRKIILSALIGRRLPGLIGIPEKDFEVSDAEIEDFVNSGLSAEENGWAKRRFHDVYLQNVNEALARLHPVKKQTVGRAATGIVEFEYGEASQGTSPVDPSKK